MENWLILAAFAPELEGLVAGVTSEAVGIGPLAAALGTARALSAHRARRVLLMGTCGAYPETQLAIGDVVLGKSTRLADAAVAQRQADFVPHDAGARPLREIETTTELREVHIATTTCVTTDDRVARLMRDAFQSEVEHLEAQGVAEACARMGVDCSVVLGVANIVGRDARAEWAAHHRLVEGRVVAWVNRFLATAAAQRA